jgi:hypothetical protein
LNTATLFIGYDPLTRALRLGLIFRLAGVFWHGSLM